MLASKDEDDHGGEELGTGHVQCSVCNSTFRRPEHLKRHLRSHTKEKPFECAQCGRHFSRSDTLHRHETSHHTLGSEGKDRTHRITVKTFRACFSCATARVRCSGGMPCGRCDTRSLECQYPTSRRSKAKATRDPEIKAESGTGHNRPTHRDSKASSHLSQFSINGSNEAASSMPLLGVFSADDSQPKSILQNAHRAIGDDSDPRAYQTNVTQEPSAAVYPGVSQTYDHSNPGAPKFPVNSSNLDCEMTDLQPRTTSTAVGIETATQNKPGSLPFDPALFDQSMLSTINWLPAGMLPGAPINHTQPVGISSQDQSLGPGPYFSRTVWQPPVIAGHTGSMHPEIISQNFSARIPLGNMESPNQYSGALSEASPRTVSVSSTKLSTDHHMEDAGRSLPKYRKNHAPWSSSSADSIDPRRPMILEHSERRFDFPVIPKLQKDNVSGDAIRFVPDIEPSTYDDIYRQFISLCRRENPFFEVFDSDNFPTADELKWFIASFFDCFQAIYPILHLPTFDPNTCPWLLTVSIAAIGCHAAQIPEMEQCTAAFHELVRRGIHVEKEKSCSGHASLEVMQAMLFNCIGLFHSQDERDKRSALGTFGELVSLSNNVCLLAAREIRLGGASEDADWICWVQDEVRRRTAYCIWLVDCTLAYYFDDKPLQSLDDGKASLPAHEKLWQASSAEIWKQLWEESSVNESLYDAVHILYIEKRLVSGIGEFSHILIIHALYHRMWEVGDYFRRPLSFWNPTAKKQSRETAIPSGSVWLPGIPSYSKWRNSACDCLDILHWTANSTISKTGKEHSTVLHLHTARLFLLAPFREIRSLTTALTNDSLSWTKRYQSLEGQHIWRWMEHDQYKARLSVIHAGLTLWHIRRYSTNAFHEPVATFIAVLTLWAYASCHAHASNESSPRSREESEVIHLDRPCDDELAQRFVRGHVMRGDVSGVGDICAVEGPERLLRVGCEILAGLTSWGISKKFVVVLTRLADLSEYHSSWERTHDNHV